MKPDLGPVDARGTALQHEPAFDLAGAVCAQIRSCLPYSHGLLTAVVSGARVTLEGEVEWSYQRERAEEAARRTEGVREVVNRVVFKPRVAPREIKRSIRDAFRRKAFDARQLAAKTAR